MSMYIYVLITTHTNDYQEVESVQWTTPGKEIQFLLTIKNKMTLWEVKEKNDYDPCTLNYFSFGLDKDEVMVDSIMYVVLCNLT